MEFTSTWQCTSECICAYGRKLRENKRIRYAHSKESTYLVKHCKDNGLPLYQVAVNFSSAHFLLEDFIAELILLVNEYQIEPKYIRLELTESIGLVNFEEAKRRLKELKRAGYESSIDDFGVGFSSLSYLHQLPVSEIKIDRKFLI